MFRNAFLVASWVLMNACGRSTNTMPTEQPRPPQAKKVPHVMVEHGHTRSDEYFWMRLSEEQREDKSPDAHTQEVIAHLKL